MEKKKLLKEIQIYSFAVTEANLYLNSHCNCRKAYEYFRRSNAKLKALVEKYEKLYGPLTARGNDGASWQWTETAWPWEYEAN